MSVQGTELFHMQTRSNSLQRVFVVGFEGGACLSLVSFRIEGRPGVIKILVQLGWGPVGLPVGVWFLFCSILV